MPSSDPRAPHRGAPSPGFPPLDPPREVREIAATLERAGFETWCVGGAVRDALLGLPHLDWDLATAATPSEIKRTFRRTVPVGERFGTIGVLDRHGRLHEVTTFRRDVRTDGRHAVVEFGASLDEDLARRDFTINAIAYSPSGGRLHDPFGGRDDLAHGIVRAVGAAHDRMREDRLRALRALRFAGRFTFRIAPETWEAIVDSAPYLVRLSKERVKQEMEKTMEQLHAPSDALRLWHASGAFRSLIPPFETYATEVFHAADVLARPDATRDPGRRRRRTLVRLATLTVGLEGDQARRIWRDLRFSNRDVDWLTHLSAGATALQGALDRAFAPGAPVADAELRRWAAVASRVRLADTLRVALARGAPGVDAGGAMRGAARSLYRRALRVAYRDPVEIADLVVDGEELMRDGGVPAGPKLGAVLRQLRDEVVEAPERNKRDYLLTRARALAATASGGTR